MMVIALGLAILVHNGPLKWWFDGLRSEKGLCCSVADGQVIADPDWETDGAHYRVRLEGKWVDVPDAAVIREPNLDGRTMVWPLWPGPAIRCFMPGSMT